MLFVFASHGRSTTVRLIGSHLSATWHPRRMTSGNGAYCPANMSRPVQKECAQYRPRREGAADGADECAATRGGRSTKSNPGSRFCAAPPSFPPVQMYYGIPATDTAPRCPEVRRF